MKDGIILAGYGTRKGNIEKVLLSQASRIKAATCFEVGIGFFRVSSPTIMEAVEKMASKGVERIVVVPYYVAEGTLTRELIPQKLGLGAGVTSGAIEAGGRKVFIHIARAFNFSPVVTDVICDRIRESGGTRDSGILVLGHGTKDQVMMNHAVIERNCQRLCERGYRHSAFAFNEFCGPTIAESLSKLVSEGVFEIVCVPLFIAMGLHLGEEIPEQIGIPAYSDGGEVVIDGKSVDIIYTKPLEDDPRLAGLAVSRAMEYLSKRSRSPQTLSPPSRHRPASDSLFSASAASGSEDFPYHSIAFSRDLSTPSPLS